MYHLRSRFTGGHNRSFVSAAVVSHWRDSKCGAEHFEGGRHRAERVQLCDLSLGLLCLHGLLTLHPVALATNYVKTSPSQIAPTLVPALSRRAAQLQLATLEWVQ